MLKLLCYPGEQHSNDMAAKLNIKFRGQEGKKLGTDWAELILGIKVLISGIREIIPHHEIMSCYKKILY